MRCPLGTHRATPTATERHRCRQSHHRRHPVQSYTALAVPTSAIRRCRTQSHENGRQDHRYAVRRGHSVDDHRQPVHRECGHLFGDHAMPQQEVSSNRWRLRLARTRATTHYFQEK